MAGGEGSTKGVISGEACLAPTTIDMCRGRACPTLSAIAGGLLCGGITWDGVCFHKSLLGFSLSSDITEESGIGFPPVSRFRFELYPI